MDDETLELTLEDKLNVVNEDLKRLHESLCELKESLTRINYLYYLYKNK